MFDIGWGELVVIGVVALIAIGPKELPGVLRATGHWMGKVRRMASEFQDQFRDAMREADLEDAKKKFDDISNTASNFTNFDPIGTVRKEFENLTKDPLSDNTTSANPAPAAPEPSAPVVSAETNEPAPPPAPEPETAQGKKPGEGA